MAVLDSATNRPMKMASCTETRPDQDLQQRDERGGPRNLQHAGEQDRPPDLPHRRQREVEADGKEQQDDAQLGQHLDVVRRR